MMIVGRKFPIARQPLTKRKSLLILQACSFFCYLGLLLLVETEDVVELKAVVLSELLFLADIEWMYNVEE
jgi:hypothetical protein